MYENFGNFLLIIFTIFPEKIYEKMGRKYGITSETTITESRVRRRFRESRVRRRPEILYVARAGLRFALYVARASLRFGCPATAVAMLNIEC